MKKFFTVIPKTAKSGFESDSYVSIPQQRSFLCPGNKHLNMDKETAFPILTAVNSAVKSGEEFSVIAILDKESESILEVFSEELGDLIQENHLKMPNTTKLYSMGENLSSNLNLFGSLIEKVADEDELYADLTFASNPVSEAILNAFRFAEKIKDNSRIETVIFANLEEGKIYDETALVRLDSLIETVSKIPCKNQEKIKILKRILEE